MRFLFCRSDKNFEKEEGGSSSILLERGLSYCCVWVHLRVTLSTPSGQDEFPRQRIALLVKVRNSGLNSLLRSQVRNLSNVINSCGLVHIEFCCGFKLCFLVDGLVEVHISWSDDVVTKKEISSQVFVKTCRIFLSWEVWTLAKTNSNQATPVDCFPSSVFSFMGPRYLHLYYLMHKIKDQVSLTIIIRYLNAVLDTVTKVLVE